MSAIAYLVGAGPWSTDLLTLRGREVLERADIVLYDYLVNPELLKWSKKTAERICVGHPPHRMTQQEICAFLVQKTREGNTVVRLKGGDPFVFGRGGEEAYALAQAQLDFEIVPGVTAAIAGAAYSGIPVTHRDFGSTLGFCTGHYQGNGPDDGIDWAGLASLSTLVFYMAAQRLGKVRDRLIEAGRDPKTPVALIQWATRHDQKTVQTTLAEIQDAAVRHQLGPPITVIIGDVVTLSSSLSWSNQRPLFQRTVVVTRSQEQSESLIQPLRELGAEVLGCPTIRFEPGQRDTLNEAIEHLASYDWVIFTSANGVRFFFEALDDQGLDSRVFGHCRVAAIGPGTAAKLQMRGLRADLVPDTFVAEGLIAALNEHNLSSARILIPRAKEAREILPNTLRSRGAHVDVVEAYVTYKTRAQPHLIERLKAGAIDQVTFTAASTVRNFCAMLGDADLGNLIPTLNAACIGPITEQEARRQGFRVDVVAREYTIQGLVDALASWGRESKGKAS